MMYPEQLTASVKGIGSIQYSDAHSVLRWLMHPYVRKFRQIWYAKIKK
jgi:hypothetical protein